MTSTTRGLACVWLVFIIFWSTGVCGASSSRHLVAGFGDTIVCNLSDEIYSTNEPELRVRSCWCRPYVDRPVAFCEQSFDSCLVHRDASVPIQCFTATRSDTFARTFWPITIFWILASLYSLFCSETGRNVRQFLLCRPRNDQQELDRILQYDREQSNDLYQRYLRRLARRGEASDAYPTLQLRTKVFQSTSPIIADAATVETEEGTQSTPNEPKLGDDPQPQQDTKGAEEEDDDDKNESNNIPVASNTFDSDEDDEHHNKCSICLLTIENGDRVGDTDCGHLLHVDCLKDWLRRKNACPLCNATVATFSNGNV